MLTMKEAYIKHLLSFEKGKQRDNAKGWIVHTGPKSKYFWVDYLNGDDLVGRINKETGEVSQVCGPDTEDSYTECMIAELPDIHKQYC